MAKIQVLDKHVAELIAAGEVVERPASVIKELFENAVDAGATTITVEIRNGGVTYMSVADNGCGIAREDVPTAFLRHATSKVRTADDLISISTLGFRGEALASVAAVARVELLTATETDEAATRYIIEGGVEQACEDAARPYGTTIIVRDLFYNVPARSKFLKKDVGEGNAVATALDRLALSHPEISVRFVRDGREELLTPGNGDLKSTIFAVMGKDFTEGLLPVDYTLGGVSIKGYICKPTYSRANRTMQHFYINGRYVHTKTAVVALEQAYKGSIMVGRFPTCVLMITLPLETVDANVHPAKMEVRFVQEKPVFDAVYYAVKSALQAGNRLPNTPVKVTDKPQPVERPKITGEQLYFRTETPTTTVPSRPLQSVSQTAKDDITVSVPVISAFAKKPLFDDDEAVFAAPKMVLHDDADKHAVELQTVSKSETVMQTEAAEQPTANVVVSVQPEEAPVRLVGEAFNTYIFAEQGGTLYCIDKHAAHERIIYNQLMQNSEPQVQMLLAPVPVALQKDEFAALVNAQQDLMAAGFEIEDFGDSTLLVRSVPMLLTGCDIAAALQEIAGGLLSGKQEITTTKQEWIYHSTACRAAVKAGDRSTPAELLELAKRVLSDEAVRYCPHGRPVCITWSQADLEKQFGRI